MSLRLFLPAALAVVFAAVVAGCGGSSHKSSPPPPPPPPSSPSRLSPGDYRAKLRSINAEVQKSTSKVTTRARSAHSVSDLRQALESLAADQNRMGDEVSQLQPPERAQAANDQLARGFHDSAAELRALLPKLSKAKTPPEAIAMLQHYQPKGGTEIDSAVSKLKQLGFTRGS